MVSDRVCLSVIVPTLDESPGISDVLARLRRQLGPDDELLVVDGGSHDDTRDRATAQADRVLATRPGRACQMNAGAAAAANEWLWFVHADTVVHDGAVALLRRHLAVTHKAWGRFDVRLSGEGVLLRLIGVCMTLRSRVTGIATGDQALFVRRDLFERTGGFPDQPLMEDVALSTRLRRVQWPLCLPVTLSTSSRRWEQQGTWRTILLMWRLRWAYWRGVDPAQLALRYPGRPQ